MFFAWLIFALILIEGIRIAGRVIKEKRKERRYISRVRNMEGGKPIKHFTGKHDW